jgi:hypothetical protein
MILKEESNKTGPKRVFKVENKSSIKKSEDMSTTSKI